MYLKLASMLLELHYFIFISSKIYLLKKMHNLPKVSIVITTFNSSQTIIETLQSVINQTFQNYEVLIFDDHSSDNTIELIKNFLEINKIDSKIFIAEKNNGGPAAGRNWGCKNAKGKYVCFLDSDDIWKSNKLEFQINLLEKNNYDVTSSNAEVINSKQFKFFSGKINIYKQIIRNRIILSSSIVRKEFIEKNKINFNEAKQYISVEDYDFFLNILLKKGEIFVVNEKLILYRFMENSISHIDIKSNEIKRLEVIKNLKTNNLPIKLFISFIYTIYKTKLLWNTK